MRDVFHRVPNICMYNVCRSHSHTLTPSHPHTLNTPSTLHFHTNLCTSTHLHTFTHIHPHTLTLSHPHTLTLSHPHTHTPTQVPLQYTRRKHQWSFLHRCTEWSLELTTQPQLHDSPDIQPHSSHTKHRRNLPESKNSHQHSGS